MPQYCVLFTKGKVGSLQHFVVATCPVKFNELNSVQHVAGTKLPKNSCYTSLPLSGNTRAHVVATALVTCTRYIFRCVSTQCDFVADTRPSYMSLLHVPATCPCCMSKLNVPVACPSYMSLLHVPDTCPCCMSQLHVPVACPSYMSLLQVLYV